MARNVLLNFFFNLFTSEVVRPRFFLTFYIRLCCEVWILLTLWHLCWPERYFLTVICNCRKKNGCPLKNNCFTSSVVYIANVTTESDTIGKNYIGLTEGTFKQRYTQHKLSFRNRNYSNSTELSKHIWTLKDSNTNFTINWSILATAPAYSNKTKRCHLCLTEKLYLIRAKKPYLLNKRSELISKCRHENKFYLANFTSRQQ